MTGPSPFDPGCETCVELAQRGRAPEHRRGGGSAALYGLVEHCISRHKATAGPVRFEDMPFDRSHYMGPPGIRRR